jgi:hypothetical protein
MTHHTLNYHCLWHPTVTWRLFIGSQACTETCHAHCLYCPVLPVQPASPASGNAAAPLAEDTQTWPSLDDSKEAPKKKKTAADGGTGPATSSSSSSSSKVS